MIYIHDPPVWKIDNGRVFFIYYVHDTGWVESIVLHGFIHFDGRQLAIATEHVAQSPHGAL